MKTLLFFTRLILFVYCGMSAFIVIFAWDLVELGAWNFTLSLIFQFLIILLQANRDAVERVKYHNVGRRK